MCWGEGVTDIPEAPAGSGDSSDPVHLWLAAVTCLLSTTGTMDHAPRNFLPRSVLCPALNAGSHTSNQCYDLLMGHNTVFKNEGTDPGATQAQTPRR